MISLSKKARKSGFSLIELMVVVGIIGILASLAIPRFKIFQAKAKQAEAKQNLNQIFVLEQSYFTDNDAFKNVPSPAGCNANDLGLYFSDCGKLRYDYGVTGASSTSFTATAISGDGENNKIYPGCPADKWTINENKDIKALNDSTKTCDK